MEIRKLFNRPVWFKDAYWEFLGNKSLSAQRHTMYISLYKAIERYFQYYGILGTLDALSAQGVMKLRIYLENENRYMVENHRLKAGSKMYLRGKNTVNDMLRKLRVFTNWCNEVGYMKVSPFSGIRIGNDTFAPPYYLTLQERKKLETLKLTSGTYLAIQRDIFLFQCCIGCRYGDLRNLRKDNINGEFVEYIASKTMLTAPKSVRVPLNETASVILRRYSVDESSQLLPVTNIQRYNRAIKRILKLSGIDRKVSVISSKDGSVRQQYIYKIAGSHLARKTFIGNLYKMVRDPNLIGSMTGHAEGSKAFCRYRDIDDDIKKEIVMKII